jgi:hypothetical protein
MSVGQGGSANASNWPSVDLLRALASPHLHRTSSAVSRDLQYAGRIAAADDLA